MLREQVITPRTGRSGGDGKGRGGAGAAQRPTRRGKGSAAQTDARRRVLASLPYVLRALLAIAVGVVLFLGYRAAASAAFFQLRSIEVVGASRASVDEIREIVRQRAGTSGVWRTDLEGLSADLSRQPWVRAVVVSRVLPSGLRVRIREREPLMVARSAQGRLVWVDDEGVTLGSFAPADRLSPFIVRGLEDAPTESARHENRERMQKALEMMKDWEARGIATRISEVNVADLRDVRVQLAGNDSQFEVRLGKEEFGTRLANALKKLDELPPAARSAVRYLDAWSRPRNIVLGLNRDAQSFAETISAERAAEAQPSQQPSQTEHALAAASVSSTTTAIRKTSESARRSNTSQSGSAASAATPARTAKTETKKRERPAKEEEKPSRAGERERRTLTPVTPAAGVKERPRRVG